MRRGGGRRKDRLQSFLVPLLLSLSLYFNFSLSFFMLGYLVHSLLHVFHSTLSLFVILCSGSFGLIIPATFQNKLMLAIPADLCDLWKNQCLDGNFPEYKKSKYLFNWCNIFTYIESVEDYIRIEFYVKCAVIRSVGKLAWYKFRFFVVGSCYMHVNHAFFICVSWPYLPAF